MTEAVLTPTAEQAEKQQVPVQDNAPQDDTSQNGKAHNRASKPTNGVSTEVQGGEAQEAKGSKAAGTVMPNGAIRPDISHIETEDDEPVDNLPSEKHQRLLVEPLYSSTILERPFLAAANVGLFDGVNDNPIVPDMLLSLGVQVADDWWAKENRSYFVWEFGKRPDVVIEIVSNRKGGEDSRKFTRYALVSVPYYVIFDPQHLLQEADLRVYELQAGRYVLRSDDQCPYVGLGLMIWEGTYEDKHDHWLRWCDLEGNVLLTGAEQAAEARQQAAQAQQQVAQAQQQAAQAQQQAAQERQRAELLAAKLRELGINPDEL